MDATDFKGRKYNSITSKTVNFVIKNIVPKIKSLNYSKMQNLYSITWTV